MPPPCLLQRPQQPHPPAGFHCSRDLYDEQRSRATGVRIINAHTRTVTEYYARIIFLNASPSLRQLSC